MRESSYLVSTLILTATLFLGSVPSVSQAANSIQISQLPSAPTPQTPPNPQTAGPEQGQTAPTGNSTTPTQNPALPYAGAPTAQSPSTMSAPSNASSGTSTAGAPRLALKDAEALAIKNNPQISVARLLALASHQVTREVRSSLWPQAVGNITGADQKDSSRIAAGLLNSPQVFEKVSAGVMVTQLMTDFGRTNNLISSANYAEKAENQNASATQQQILLAVNQAFFNALQAQAVLTVAQETVKERQTVADQVGTLYKNKLKSELDYSFASVNLAQAQLLLLDAENNQNATLATLSMVLGYSTEQNYQLVEETSPLTAPPANLDILIAQAFADRPEILSLQYQVQSAKRFQTAERDLLFPTIEAMGTVGVTPVGNPVVAPSPIAFNNTYAAVGANMQIPLFNGFLYFARAKEASLKTRATDERLRHMRDLISRDVRTSWLNANTAYQRLSVTQQLLREAKLALDLAQARYKLGLGSIVELSQAQLQETQAEISFAEAGYDYRLSLAVLTYETTGI